MHVFYMCKYLGMHVIVFHESRKELRNTKIWKTLFQAYRKKNLCCHLVVSKLWTAVPKEDLNITKFDTGNVVRVPYFRGKVWNS
jgi:hypothetical protein